MNKLTNNILLENIEDIKKRGAEYSDIYVQSSSSHSFHYENGQVDEISSTSSDGTGARIILDGKSYYAHTPGSSLFDIRRAVNEVSDNVFNTRIISEYNNNEILCRTELNQPQIEFMSEVDNLLRKESKDIRQVSMRYSTSEKNVIIASPDGRVTENKRFYTSFTTQIIMDRNSDVETGYERYCLSVDYGNFWNNKKPEEVALKALERAELMYSAKRCPAGKMDVIMAGEAGGTIVHEACGHGLEADIIKKDYSVYRDKIGERVASENITMVDDPTLKNLYGYYRYDDEGTPSHRNVLIENGILKGYMTDYLSAKMTGLGMTGNGRRESYRYMPMPRMSNTFLLPGNTELEEMIENADKALFVKKMGGGEVNPTSGDFVFYVSEGYLVEKGKILYPVKGATIIGNGPKALNSIKYLGNSSVMDPGICGKSGQSVPVTDGQPSMYINGLTIGGNEE